jgi:Fe-S cluster assembly protein SufB
MFYCAQRGLAPEDAQSVILNGFVRDVVRRLPLEFAVEANRLLEINLEGTVG